MSFCNNELKTILNKNALVLSIVSHSKNNNQNSRLETAGGHKVIGTVL